MRGRVVQRFKKKLTLKLKQIAVAWFSGITEKNAEKKFQEKKVVEENVKRAL